MNKELFGDNNFWLVCSSCGSFLEDQSAENIEYFENIMDNLDPDTFQEDLELIKDDQEYLTATTGIVSYINEKDWYLKDIGYCVNRLDHYFTDITSFLDHDQSIKYLQSLETIRKNLDKLKNSYCQNDYSNIENYLNNICEANKEITEIYYLITDTLEDCNFHTENRTLRNEPLQISSDVNVLRWGR